MSELTISRRGLLAGSALLLVSTALPAIGFAQTPKKGGRLVLAADSEPRNLNPAIVASNGVFFISSKIVEALQNLGRTVFKDLEAVDTPDELTAVFKFAKPTPFQLIRNALPALSSVVPKHLYENGKIEDNPANNAPVGTGPFKFAEYKAGQYYRLTRNDAYWGKDEPYLDEIVYQVLPDRTSAAAALEAEEIQLAAFSAVP
ncbi:MAG: ABC transporter substrate-binding protein, partial [Mesorhizobium sp.]